MGHTLLHYLLSLPFGLVGALAMVIVVGCSGGWNWPYIEEGLDAFGVLCRLFQREQLQYRVSSWSSLP